MSECKMLILSVRGWESAVLAGKGKSERESPDLATVRVGGSAERWKEDWIIELRIFEGVCRAVSESGMQTMLLELLLPTSLSSEASSPIDASWKSASDERLGVSTSGIVTARLTERRMFSLPEISK